MSWFEIRPRDVWLFRDGRPFNAGEDNSARSLFPPTPLTVQGALRQQISESNGVSYYQYRTKSTDDAIQISEWIGAHKAQETQLDTGKFRMHGPFLSVRLSKETEGKEKIPSNEVMPLFPCPADLLVHTDSDTKQYDDARISAPGTEVSASDLGTDFQFLKVIEDYENLVDHWLTGAAFEAYMTGQPPAVDTFVQPERTRGFDSDQRESVYKAVDTGKQVIPSESVYKFENRFGVSTNSATSFREEGMLYQTQFVRPADHVGLLVEVTGLHADQHVQGLMTIGGEQRQAYNDRIEVQHFPSHPKKLTGEFKVIFLTPAYLKGGWLPMPEGMSEEDSPSDRWSQLFGSKVELVSAALYRPQPIGGWNSARGTQRTMHNYVAPGSVYYFHTEGAIQPPPTLTETPERMANAAHIGFGQIAYSNQW